MPRFSRRQARYHDSTVLKILAHRLRQRNHHTIAVNEGRAFHPQRSPRFPCLFPTAFTGFGDMETFAPRQETFGIFARNKGMPIIAAALQRTPQRCASCRTLFIMFLDHCSYSAQLRYCPKQNGHIPGTDLPMISSNTSMYWTTTTQMLKISDWISTNNVVVAESSIPERLQQ